MMNDIKLVWQKLDKKPMVLTAKARYDHGAITSTGLREEHIDPIQEWCQNNNCGQRISFDMFRFKTSEEMTTFLLRWS